MLNEIIKSCGNAAIAEAAVRSIGYSFAEEVLTAACQKGMTLGAFTAAAVRRFDRHAEPDARDALLRRMRRTDQPILVGLRFILEEALRDDEVGLKRRAPGGFSLAHDRVSVSSCMC